MIDKNSNSISSAVSRVRMVAVIVNNISRNACHSSDSSVNSNGSESNRSSAGKPVMGLVLVVVTMVVGQLL